jgi:hypothetical protein
MAKIIELTRSKRLRYKAKTNIKENNEYMISSLYFLLLIMFFVGFIWILFPILALSVILSLPFYPIFKALDKKKVKEQTFLKNRSLRLVK